MLQPTVINRDVYAFLNPKSAGSVLWHGASSEMAVCMAMFVVLQFCNIVLGAVHGWLYRLHCMVVVVAVVTGCTGGCIGCRHTG